MIIHRRFWLQFYRQNFFKNITSLPPKVQRCKVCVHLHFQTPVILDMLLNLDFSFMLSATQFSGPKSRDKHLHWRNWFCHHNCNSRPSSVCIADWKYASKSAHVPFNCILGLLSTTEHENIVTFFKAFRVVTRLQFVCW